MRTYKVTEVAEILKVTTRTVRSEMDKNKLKFFKVGSEIRVTESALSEYMNLEANRGITEREAELERENQELKEKMSRLQNILGEFKNILLKV